MLYVWYYLHLNEILLGMIVCLLFWLIKNHIKMQRRYKEEFDAVNYRNCSHQESLYQASNLCGGGEIWWRYKRTEFIERHKKLNKGAVLWLDFSSVVVVLAATSNGSSVQREVFTDAKTQLLWTQELWKEIKLLLR